MKTQNLIIFCKTQFIYFNTKLEGNLVPNMNKDALRK